MDQETRAVPEEIRGRPFNILWISAKSSRNNPRGCCEWSNADFASQDEIWCSPTAASRTISRLVQIGYIGIVVRNGSRREIRLTELGWSVIKNKEREVQERKAGRYQGRVMRKRYAECQAAGPKESANRLAPLADRSVAPGKSPGMPGKMPGLLSTPETPKTSCTPEPAVWRKIKAELMQNSFPVFAGRLIDPVIATMCGDELHLQTPDPLARKHIMHRYLPAIRESAACENIAGVFVT